MSGGADMPDIVFCTEGRNYEPEIKSRHYWCGSSYTPELLEGFIKRYHELRSANYGWWMSKVVKRNWILFRSLPTDD